MTQANESVHYEKRKRVTRREWFLQVMNDIIPWSDWVDYIFTVSPNQWLGYPSGRMEKLLRLYLLQIWFNMDEETILENAYDSHAMRAFLGEPFDALPDAAMLIRFRTLLDNEHISEKLSGSINRALHKGGAVLRGGSIMDAAIIRAPRRIPETKGHGHWAD